MSNEKLSAGIGEAAGLRDGIYVGQPVSHSMTCVSGEDNNVVASRLRLPVVFAFGRLWAERS